MVKKILALNIALIMSISSLFAFSGTWEFHTMFSQTVEKGIVTLEPLDTNIIKSIWFTDKATDRDRTGMIKGAIVEILDPVSDKYIVVTNADYFDSPNDAAFNLFLSKDAADPHLSIFTVSDVPELYWFSYAISMEAFYQGVITAPMKDTDSLNMVGVMKKVRW